MDLDLSGKVALVTGSTAGIGLAIATGLAEAGAHVWVNGRTSERVDSAIARIRSSLPGANRFTRAGGSRDRRRRRKSDNGRSPRSTSWLITLAP